MKFITSRKELREAYESTHDVAVQKEMRSIDPHSKRFIERSPFVFIGSQDSSGNGDVSLK